MVPFGALVFLIIRSVLVYGKHNEDTNERLTHIHFSIGLALAFVLGVVKENEKAYNSAIVHLRLVFNDEFFQKYSEAVICPTLQNVVVPVKKITTIPSIGVVNDDEKRKWIKDNSFKSRIQFEATVNEWDVEQQQYNYALNVSLLFLMLAVFFTAIQSGFYRGIKAKDHDMHKKNADFKERDYFMGTEIVIHFIIFVTGLFFFCKRWEPSKQFEKAKRIFTPAFFNANPDLFPCITEQPQKNDDFSPNKQLDRTDSGQNETQRDDNSDDSQSNSLSADSRSVQPTVASGSNPNDPTYTQAFSKCYF